jgi:hypothetical protein
MTLRIYDTRLLTPKKVSLEHGKIRDGTYFFHFHKLVYQVVFFYDHNIISCRLIRNLENMDQDFYPWKDVRMFDLREINQRKYLPQIVTDDPGNFHINYYCMVIS